MSEYKTPEDILKTHAPYAYSKASSQHWIVQAMREYAMQERERSFIEGRDKALEYAVNHFYDDISPIISGKTAKELQP